MDIYRKYRGVNGCNQGLEEFFGFHFFIKEGRPIIEGKNSNHIINESVNTDTHGCGICWLEWMPFKVVMNFIDDCINVNTIIIDEFETLEKSNSDTGWKWRNNFSIRLKLKERTHKGTYVFIFLEVFNSFMDRGEFFRLYVNNKFTHFFIIG